MEIELQPIMGGTGRNNIYYSDRSHGRCTKYLGISWLFEFPSGTEVELKKRLVWSTMHG